MEETTAREKKITKTIAKNICNIFFRLLQFVNKNVNITKITYKELKKIEQIEKIFFLHENENAKNN